MRIIDNERLAPAALPGIEHRTLACRDEGLSGLSLWQQSMAAGAATPPHSHDCEEVVVVLAGRGKLLAGDTLHAFGPGTTLVIPPGIPHQIVSTGPGVMRLVAAFGATPVGTFAPDGVALDLPWRS